MDTPNTVITFIMEETAIRTTVSTCTSSNLNKKLLLVKDVINNKKNKTSKSNSTSL